MIPYEDLVAALDHWRARNGLPLGTADVPSIAVAAPSARPIGAPVARPAPAAVVAAPAPAPFVMPTAAAATAPRPVSTTARAGTDSDVLAIDDAMLENDLYENEGSDFSMSFGGSGNPVGSVSGSIGGATPPPAAAPTPPAMHYDEQAGYPAAEPAAAYDDPAYDEPVAAGMVESAEDAPPPEEEEEDWSKLPGFPGAGLDTVDAEHDIIDEATVVGSTTPKR